MIQCINRCFDQLASTFGADDERGFDLTELDHIGGCSIPFMIPRHAFDTS